MKFEYNINPDFDYIIDEKGNSIVTLRKASWNNREEKLELRKWIVNSEGKETYGKGFAFLTEEGPNELIKTLLENNYGDTETVINSVKDRSDFMPALCMALEVANKTDLMDKLSKEEIEEEYYDPTQIFD